MTEQKIIYVNDLLNLVTTQKQFEEIPAIEEILKYYYKPEKTYHVYFQCSVLFGYGMTKEQAERKRDEWNALQDYNPPAVVCEDNSDFPELYLEQFEEEFKVLLYDYIKRKELATSASVDVSKAVYQSIFDCVLSLNTGDEYEDTLELSRQIKGTKKDTFINGYTTALNVVTHIIKQKMDGEND